LARISIVINISKPDGAPENEFPGTAMEPGIPLERQEVLFPPSIFEEETCRVM
jgi:hypothetical protein